LILIDTSILSRVFRRSRPGPREEALRERLDLLAGARTPLGIPAVVLLETLSGIRTETQFLDLEQKLLAAFEVVHANTEDHVQAARLRNECQSTGLNVSGIDCLIARITMAHGHRLFAIDGDFQKIAKVAPLKLYKFNAR
jgi:predicted nucleic acid-binding protein